MEIVTEPNFSSAFETSSFVYELAQLLKALNVCEVNLKEGGFRVDVNISVHKIDENNNEENSDRIELKNINNLNSIRKAIDYEIDRQIKLKLDGKQHEITLQTRGYDSVKEITYLLRVKDTFYDYRFMPEPNLLPLFIYTVENNNLIDNKVLIIDDNDIYKEFKESILSQSNEEISGINIDEIVERFKKCRIPKNVRQMLNNDYLLTPQQAFLIETNKYENIFIGIISKNEELDKLTPKVVTRYYKVLMSEYTEALNKNKDYASILTVEKLANYFCLLKTEKLDHGPLKNILFNLMLKEENLNKTPTQICNENNLYLISDEETLLNCVNNLLDSKSYDKLVKKYHNKPKYAQNVVSTLISVIQKELNQRGDGILLHKLVIEGLNKRKPF